MVTQLMDVHEFKFHSPQIHSLSAFQIFITLRKIGVYHSHPWQTCSILGCDQGTLKNYCPSEWLRRGPMCKMAMEKQELRMSVHGIQAPVEEGSHSSSYK